MEYYLRSHVGKVRTNNEDFVGQFPICEQAHIFIVSDAGKAKRDKKIP